YQEFNNPDEDEDEVTIPDEKEDLKVYDELSSEWDLCEENNNNDIEVMEGTVYGAEDMEQFGRNMFSVECSLVFPIDVQSGILKISNKYIYFNISSKGLKNTRINSLTPSPSPYTLKSLDVWRKRMSKDRKWSILDIVSVSQRRYLLQRTAIEIFLRN